MVELSSIFSSLGDYSLILIIVFIILVVVAVKVTKMIIGLFVAGVFGALFPYLVNNILKIEGIVDPGLETSIIFALLAMIIYGVYSLLRFLYSTAAFTGKAFTAPLKILSYIGDSTIRILSAIGSSVIYVFSALKRLSAFGKGHDKESDRISSGDKDGIFVEKYDDGQLQNDQRNELDTEDGDDVNESKHEDGSAHKKIDESSFMSKAYMEYDELKKKNKD